jgi:hypothetical protein
VEVVVKEQWMLVIPLEAIVRLVILVCLVVAVLVFVLVAPGQPVVGGVG